MPIGDNKDEGVSGAAKGVTSGIGNLVGGVTRTAGSVVGSAGQGLGDTINSTTGTKQGGDALKGVTGGIKDGADSMGKGAENAGEWKK